MFFIRRKGLAIKTLIEITPNPACAQALRAGVPFDATVVSMIIRDFIHLTERLTSFQLDSLLNDYYAKLPCR